MAILSFHGSATPPGTWAALTDGTPRIVTATAWYFTAGSTMRGKNCVGGKVYVPAGMAGKTLRVTLWQGGAVLPSAGSGIDLSGTPLRTEDALISDNTAHWESVTWDTAYVISSDFYLLAVGHEYTDAAGTYHHGNDVRADGGPTAHPTVSTWLWSEDGGPYAGGYFRVGTGTTTKISDTRDSYGNDILIDDGVAANQNPTANAGVDQNVSTNVQVTLSGSGSSDPDGTIASYAWTQISGPTVTLSGTGSVRTFTPTAAGSYIFGLTVTDDDGASSTQDTVTVTVTAPAGSIVAENGETGIGQANWLDGVGSEEMPAFPRSTYYLPGETAEFSIDYNSAFNVEIYRLGHYQDLGARRVQTAFAGTPTSQPSPVAITGANGAITCAAWSVNASWAVPAGATPGWYYALFKGTNGTDFGHALFCVSDKNAKKPIVIVASDATWHAAYNGYGGNNVYGAVKGIGDFQARAFCSTYDKPVISKDYVPQTHFFNTTYPYLKWSERMGYEAGVTTIEQIKDDPTILDGRSLVVWTGHNEYVPQSVMDKTKALLASGQKMLNIAGNDFFWRVKFTDGGFSSATTGRNMWCKKDTMDGPSTGPNAVPAHDGGTPFTTEADWTGTWQDTRWTLREPSENFFGDRFVANGIRADQVKVPFSMKGYPAWRDCPGIQALTSGQDYSFAAGTLGMEWDKPMTANTNVDQTLFSSTTVALAGGAADENGENYNLTETATHGFSMVKNGSAYVANFNSDQWPWALDSLHLRGSAAEDVNAMQMMLNVIADFGVSPDSGSVTAASLTYPAATSNLDTAYGFDASEPPPVTTSFITAFYSNGTEWLPVGVEQ